MIGIETPLPDRISALRILPLEEDEARWDGFVRDHERGTFCHLAGWRSVIQDTLGQECLYRVAVDPTGAWRGVLPLVRIRSTLLGHYLISVPFLNYGGPVGEPEGQTELVEWATQEARRSGARLLEIRAPAPIACRLPTARPKVTVLLPLPESVEELWSDVFRAKLRSQIRRPLKEGMEVRFGDSEVEGFYEVFSRTMRSLGTPVHPLAFFRALPRLFGERVVFGTVYWRDQPVAAGCGLVWGAEFEMTWAAALREFNAKSPNMLLYAAFMERMIRRGVRNFNFGRCDPGSGTHRFKLQWGGAELPLPWLQWTRRGGERLPSATRPAFRLATRLWSRLPLVVTRALGPALARRLPNY